MAKPSPRGLEGALSTVPKMIFMPSILRCLELPNKTPIKIQLIKPTEGSDLTDIVSLVNLVDLHIRFHSIDVSLKGVLAKVF